MNISGVTKHFATPSEVYTNNLSASISAGAVTVPVNANNDYTDGDIVVLTVEPGTTNEATFTGEKASTPARFINCVWTEGNVGVGHASGVTITDYDSATHFGMATKGIKLFANQDGTLKTSAVQAALNISSAVPSDYTSLAQTATTITPNGSRSYSMLFPGVNYTDRLSQGMRLRTVRSAVAPNQCALFDGVNDYFNKVTPAGMTFTDDFVVSAWIKLTSYPTTDAGIVSRANASNGWWFGINASGQLILSACNGAAGNYSRITSAQSVPLNKWVHVAAQLDMSAYTATTTTSYVMIDGTDVPGAVFRAGTAPTTLVQGTNFEIGTINAANFFTGKIAQAAVFNSKVTQATIRGYMSQSLSGGEASLISAYTFSNSINDLNTTNANNLTANGGVLATTADAPFGGQGNDTISTTVDYGIIQTATYSAPDTTVVLQVPIGCTIPTSGGVASVSYSQFDAPYLFPNQNWKFDVEVPIYASVNAASGSSPVWFQNSITVPIGEWDIGYNGNFTMVLGGAGVVNSTIGLNTTKATITPGHPSLTRGTCVNIVEYYPLLNRSFPETITTPKTYHLNGKPIGSTFTNFGLQGGESINYITARNAYV